MAGLACALLASRCSDPFEIHLTVDDSPSWSPDGDSLVYVHLSNIDGQPSGIYVVNVATRQTRMVLGGQTLSVDWSPGGKAFVFARDYGLFVYDYSKDSVSQIHSGLCESPAWSPDSTQIAFDDLQSVYVLSAGGGPASAVAPGRDPRWSPDSRSLVISRRGPGSTEEEIVLIKRDGELIRGLTKMTNGFNRFPAWSRDGTSVAWLAESDAGNQLCTIDTSGASRKVLSKMPITVGGRQDWSPASDRIAFVAYNAFNNPRLFTIRRDGTDQEQLTSYPGTRLP